MNNTELDKWAAETVMGWQPMIQDEHTGLWRRGSNFVAFIPTSDANDDITVRDKWLAMATEEQKTEADRVLHGTCGQRGDEFVTAWYYRPGDFTRAIHAAMEVRQ